MRSLLNNLAPRTHRGAIRSLSRMESLEGRMLFAASVLDPTFGGGDGVASADFGGRVDEAADIATTPGGRMLVAGTSIRTTPLDEDPPPGADFAVARFRADGSLDSTFGADGMVTTDFYGRTDFGTALTVLPDGRFVIVGSATRKSATNLAVARYLADGSLDPTFDHDGRAVLHTAGASRANAVAVLPDGDLLVAGNSDDPSDGATEALIVRYNPDGTRDRSFGSGDGIVTARYEGSTFSTANALALAPRGKFVVAGSASGSVAVARFNADGSPDTTFGGEGQVITPSDYEYSDATATAVIVDADGDFLAAGSDMATFYDHYYGDEYYSLHTTVRRYDRDGSTVQRLIDTSVDADSRDASASPDLVPFPGGRFGLSDDVSHTVTRFTPDLRIDEAFGDRGHVELGTVEPVAVAADSKGRVLLAAAHASDFQLVRLKRTPNVPVDPDDQISEASPVDVGASRSGSIDPATDVDIYQFTVAAGQRLTFDVDVPAGSTLDPMLRVINPGGEEMSSSDDDPAPGEPHGAESYLRQFFAYDGTYYVGVSASPNDRYNPIDGTGDRPGPGGSYKLTLTDVPAPADHDDQISEAGNLARDAARSGAIEHDLDVDVYAISAAAGQRFAIDLDLPAASPLLSMLKVFDPAGAPVEMTARTSAPGEAAAEGESYVEFQFGAAGTYYAAVSGRSNQGYDVTSGTGDAPAEVGPYMLVLHEIPPDGDDQIGEAALLSPAGSGVSGRISRPYDVDMYRFTASAGRPVAIDLDASAAEPWDSLLRVFDAAGNELAASGVSPAPDESNSGEAYVEFLPAASGTCYVGVASSANRSYDPVTGEEDFREFGGKGAYVVKLSALAKDSDDQVGEAAPLRLGSAVRGTIDVPTDVDLYRIDVRADQELALDVDRRSGSSLDPYLALFSADGSRFSEADDGPAPGEPRTTAEPYLEYFFETAGTYYVAVSGADKKDPLGGNTRFNALTGLYDRPGSTGDYTLSVTDISPPPDPDDQIAEAVRVRPGVAVEATLDERDADLYRFTAKAGDRLSLVIDDAAVTLHFRVFDRGGVELLATDDPVEFGRYEVPADGAYYLGISESSNQSYDPVTGAGDYPASSGPYRFTLTPRSPASDRDDQISEAKSLAAGRRTAGVFDFGDDVNMYRFMAAAGQEMLFEAQSPQTVPYLELFDSTGQRLEQSASSLRHVFAEAGTYYAGVSVEGNQDYDPRTGLGDYDTGATGAYAMTASVIPADGDDQISEAKTIAIGGSRSGGIGNRFDVDVYVVQVAAGARLSFDLDAAAGSGLDSYLRLFDDQGTQLHASDDDAAPGEAEGADSYIEYVLAVAGKYYVAVSGASNSSYDVATGFDDRASSTGAYVLRVARS